jgi:hypothetical protein
MTLTGSGSVFIPSKFLETLCEAVLNIGNGGLEAAQIAEGASSQKQPAVSTPKPAHKQRVSTFVEIPGGEPV